MDKPKSFLLVYSNKRARLQLSRCRHFTLIFGCLCFSIPLLINNFLRGLFITFFSRPGVCSVPGSNCENMVMQFRFTENMITKVWDLVLPIYSKLQRVKKEPLCLKLPCATNADCRLAGKQGKHCCKML